MYFQGQMQRLVIGRGHIIFKSFITFLFYYFLGFPIKKIIFNYWFQAFHHIVFSNVEALVQSLWNKYKIK